jgi:hypothetical protein
MRKDTNLPAVEVRRGTDFLTWVLMGCGSFRHLYKRYQVSYFTSQYVVRLIAGDDLIERSVERGSLSSFVEPPEPTPLCFTFLGVKPEIVADASGGKWEPLFKVPATLPYLFAVLTIG